LIVAEPRRIPLADVAGVYLQLKPGTDVALFNALAHVIIREGLEDKEYIKKRTAGFKYWKEIVEKYPPEYVSEITGVPAEAITKAARLFAGAESGSIIYGIGVTQQPCGAENVVALTNLALVTGNLGKPSAGINPLRGQNNQQGASDMGCVPDLFSGYHVIADEIRAKFSKAWGVELSDVPGRTVAEMFHPDPTRRNRVMYIMGENPVVSSRDADLVRECLQEMDFVVVQDIFLTETAEYADVVLPAASFAEKDGTFINTERRVQRVRRAVKPRGESKPDWEILQLLAQRFNLNWDYSSPEEIWDEVRRLIPHYFGGMSYERLEEGGLQWPCPSEYHPGTPIMYKGEFAMGQFSAVEYTPPVDVSEVYPFILTAGRKLYQHCSTTMTNKTDGLNYFLDEDLMEISPEDAQALELTSGDMVGVTSRRGCVETKI
jgi:predicted molibdopterin-dependent oxidoreductase YjgC